MEWRPDGFTFTVDGDPFYRVTKAAVEEKGRWAFDNPKFLILNFALGGAYPQGVNRIQRPYPGIAQSTVELITAGKATMMVDWVRVTRN
jgi:hypothetical protein